MTQLLVAHVKLKTILKLIQKFNPCVNSRPTHFVHWTRNGVCICRLISSLTQLNACGFDSYLTANA